MTLPQNVKDAMDYINASGFKGAPTYEASWQAIRAHLMSQEAEIDRLRGITPELPPMPPDGAGLPRYGLRWNGPQLPLATPMGDGYWTPWHLAESRLTAANALLREAIGWNWLDEDAPQQAGVNADTPSVMDDLYLKIQAHLQGAGDEAV